MDIVSIVIGAVIGLVVGAIIIFLLQKTALKSKADAIQKEAEVEGEAMKKEKIINK